MAEAKALAAHRLQWTPISGAATHMTRIGSEAADLSAGHQESCAIFPISGSGRVPRVVPACRLLLVVVLGALGVGVLVGAFVLVRRVGLSPLAASLLVGWLSPVLVGGPLVLCVVALQRARPAISPPAAPGDARGEKEQVR